MPVSPKSTDDLAATLLIRSGSSPSGLSGETGELETPEARLLLEDLRTALAPRFTIARPLGVGGMGAVYLGADPLLRRSVAVKVLLPSMAAEESARARFLREAELVAAVAHPNVVAIYDVGVLPVSGAPYFVMQFVDGVDLAALLEEARVTPELQARRVIGEVASALAAAHARGLVHRDIKPHNVLIERDSGRAVVVDFGIGAVIARRGSDGPGGARADGADRSDIYLGTPTYTSPEQAAGGSITGKSDVYSLGVMAFELLTGAPPFTAKTVSAMLHAHLEQAPPHVATQRPDLSPAFASIVDRCLAKEPEARPSAAEVARALIPEGAAQRALEWPPPGLDVLARRGRLVLRALSLAAMSAAIFLGILAVQPTTDSGRWDAPEASSFWSHVGTGAFSVARTASRENDSAVIWFFLLSVAAVATLLSLVALLITTARCGLALRDASSAGYPWHTTRDVALDWWPDGGALRNESGPFALLGGARCEDLMRWRRAAAVRLALTLALIVLTPWLFLARVYGGWLQMSTVVFPGREVLFALLPVSTGFALVASARSREWSQRLRSRRVWTLTPRALWRSTVSARPEVISSWIRAAGDRRQPSERRGNGLFASLTLITAIIAVPATGACMALVFVLGNITHVLHDAQRDAYGWVESYRHDSLSSQRVDSVLARAAAGGHRAMPYRERVARHQLETARRLLRDASSRNERQGEALAMSAARHLRAAGLASGDDQAVIDALRVRNVIPHLGEAHPSAAGARALMADPDAPPGLGFIGDTRFPPSVRVLLAVRGIPGGYCLDPREVLFGIDPRRETTLRTARKMLHDVRGGDTLVMAAERWLQTVATGASSETAVPGWLAPLGWVGLGGVRTRAAICLADEANQALP